MRKGKAKILTIVLIIIALRTFGQQFNSDSWLSKPHGVVTIIPTIGQRNMMFMNTFSLFRRWEFTVAAYLYNNDGDAKTNDGYSTSFYGKYMIYENEAQTGGFAVKAGTGMFPGFLDGEDRVRNAFKTYWMNVPITIPLWDNKVSWDIMPGASYTSHFESGKESGWAATYSTRVAWYPFSPATSIVGEIFGAEGEMRAKPEYKVGLRWEPGPYSVFAITYGDEFNGTNGAGIEFGVMLFSPAFAKIKLKSKNKSSEKE